MTGTELIRPIMYLNMTRTYRLKCFLLVRYFPLKTSFVHPLFRNPAAPTVSEQIAIDYPGDAKAHTSRNRNMKTLSRPSIFRLKFEPSYVSLYVKTNESALRGWTELQYRHLHNNNNNNHVAVGRRGKTTVRQKTCRVDAVLRVTARLCFLRLARQYYS